MTNAEAVELAKMLESITLDKDNFPRMNTEKVSITMDVGSLRRLISFIKIKTKEVRLNGNNIKEKQTLPKV